MIYLFKVENKIRKENNMENLEKQLIGEVEKETFKVDSDQKADWVIRKIKSEEEELNRLVNCAEAIINEYKQKIEDYKTKFKNKTSHFYFLLQEYFKTVKPKETKTQKKYTLPSGDLVLKKSSIKFIRDDDKFKKWLKENNYEGYIKTIEKVEWGDFKKALKVTYKDGNIITENGEVVDGVIGEETEEEFVIK